MERPDSKRGPQGWPGGTEFRRSRALDQAPLLGHVLEHADLGLARSGRRISHSRFCRVTRLT